MERRYDDAEAAPPPGRWRRAAVYILLALFLAATVATTAVSLGRYCLTTDAADTRALPHGR
jgi:hypothetical protein